MSLHSCCGEYMTTGSKPLEAQLRRWTDGDVYECVWLRWCVGQRSCKVIPYITTVPASLHNTYNASTPMSARPFCKWNFLPFLSSIFNFLPFHPKPVTLTLCQPFYCIMSASYWVPRSLKWLLWYHFLPWISHASGAACELRTAAGRCRDEHVSGMIVRLRCTNGQRAVNGRWIERGFS